MGFFKKILGGKTVGRPETESSAQPPFQNSNTIQTSYTEQGRLVVEFTDKRDITTLVIDYVDYSFEDGERSFQKCMISHRRQGDMIRLEPNEWGVMIGEYYQIYTRVNRNALQENGEYCLWVMQGLLNKDRVKRYIGMGMQECPEKMCGNYVGEVSYDTSNNKFVLGFDDVLGSKMHNTPEMIEKRKMYRQAQQKQEEENARKRDMRRQKLLDELEKLS